MLDLELTAMKSKVITLSRMSFSMQAKALQSTLCTGIKEASKMSKISSLKIERDRLK